MKDGVKIHAMADFGISIQRQRLFAPMRNIPCSSSQAEIRRSMLRWRLKKRIALRNSILFWVLFISICVIEAMGLTVLGGMLSLALTHNGTLARMFIAMVIILGWLYTYSYLDDKIETNPNYLQLKR